MSDASELLDSAQAAVNEIEQRFNASSFAEQVAMKSDRDKAFNAFAAARLKSIQSGITCTADDLKEMRKLRDEVNAAADKQSLLVAIGRVAGFLAKFAL